MQLFIAPLYLPHVTEHYSLINHEFEVLTRKLQPGDVLQNKLRMKLT